MRDFTTDPVARPLIQAGLAGTLPDWALGAPIPDLDTLAKLASNAFADPAHRLLPCHTKEATLCSAVYVAAQSGLYPEGTEGRVKAAAAALGVTAECDTILNAERPKQAAAETVMEKAAFALVLEDGAPYGLPAGGHQFLPIHDSYSVERSGEELAKSASLQTLPPEMIHAAAIELVKAARAKNCLDTVPPHMLSLGTERMADWDKAALLIQDRVKVVGKDGLAPYNDLIKLGSEHPEHTDAVIDGLRDLDAGHNIAYWNKAGSVISPWEAIYSGVTFDEIEKMAASHVVLGGALVPMPVLTALSADKVQTHFAKSAADKILAAQKAGNTTDASEQLAGLEGDLQVRLFGILKDQ